MIAAYMIWGTRLLGLDPHQGTATLAPGIRAVAVQSGMTVTVFFALDTRIPHVVAAAIGAAAGLVIASLVVARTVAGAKQTAADGDA